MWFMSLRVRNMMLPALSLSRFQSWHWSQHLWKTIYKELGIHKHFIGNVNLPKSMSANFISYLFLMSCAGQEPLLMKSKHCFFCSLSNTMRLLFHLIIRYLKLTTVKDLANVQEGWRLILDGRGDHDGPFQGPSWLEQPLEWQWMALYLACPGLLRHFRHYCQWEPHQAILKWSSNGRGALLLRLQIMMENIHLETYSLLINTYIKDPAQRECFQHCWDDPLCHKESRLGPYMDLGLWVNICEASRGTHSRRGHLFLWFICINLLVQEAWLHAGACLLE